MKLHVYLGNITKRTDTKFYAFINKIIFLMEKGGLMSLMGG